MSISVEIGGRMVDISDVRKVSEEDRILLREELVKNWNKDLDGLYGELTEHVRGLSENGKRLFAYGMAARRVFKFREKLVSGKREEYKVGDFIVAIICSCNPMYSFLELGIRKKGEDDFVKIEYRSHCQGSPNYTVPRLDEHDPRINEFFAAYDAFLVHARSDEERIIFWFGVNHVTAAAFAEYFKRWQ